MKKYDLPVEAQFVYNLSNIVGAISIGQIELLTKKSKKEPIKTMNLLQVLGYTKSHSDTYLTPRNKQIIDKDAIACLWVMIDLCTDDDDVLDLKMFETVMGGMGNITNFTYIQDNSLVINLIYIGDKDKAKLTAANQRFYDYTGVERGKEKEAGVAYVFVTNSKEMAAYIKKNKPAYPHRIAYLEGPDTEMPQITYL